MGQLILIGNTAGKAAPGEYGNSALLTARGDGVYRDSTGLPVRQPLGAAGLFLGSDGTDQKYRYPPGYASVVDLGANVGGTVTETSLLSTGAAIAGGFPAAQAILDRYVLEAGGYFQNSSGTNTYTSQIQVYHGTYPIHSAISAALTSTATTTNVRVWRIKLTATVTVLGTTSVGQITIDDEDFGFNAVTGLVTRGSGYAASVAGSFQVRDGFDLGTNAALATNAARNFNITATHSNASASLNTRMNYCRVMFHPKNY
jgi:hypothetical protein